LFECETRTIIEQKPLKTLTPLNAQRGTRPNAIHTLTAEGPIDSNSTGKRRFCFVDAGANVKHFR
jgi:hypothetical protein